MGRQEEAGGSCYILGEKEQVSCLERLGEMERLNAEFAG